MCTATTLRQAATRPTTRGGVVALGARPRLCLARGLVLPLRASTARPANGDASNTNLAMPEGVSLSFSLSVCLSLSLSLLLFVPLLEARAANE
jgi:hypothetical protein